MWITLNKWLKILILFLPFCFVLYLVSLWLVPLQAVGYKGDYFIATFILSILIFLPILLIMYSAIKWLKVISFILLGIAILLIIFSILKLSTSAFSEEIFRPEISQFFLQNPNLDFYKECQELEPFSYTETIFSFLTKCRLSVYKDSVSSVEFFLTQAKGTYRIMFTLSLALGFFGSH